MKYHAGDVSKTTKIVFPIVVTAVAGLVRLNPLHW